ncbi:serine hydrolase [Streptomyces sp. HUAS TT7]|uniref:serine hydrolase n=1 Tax=Streptomyces sp. HUAS TT7 TaxID=3447507 RepID=UPI003F660452
MRADARRNRDKSLTAAVRVPAKEGVDARLEPIAKEAGVGSTPLYRSGADGSMTGTAHDVNRFFSALASGRLLKPADLAAMQTTVPVPPDSGEPAGTRDGLGLFVNSLSRDGSYLGRGGSGFGYVIRTAPTTDGRRGITVSAHTRPADPQTAARREDTLRSLVDHALCHTA